MIYYSLAIVLFCLALYEKSKPKYFSTRAFYLGAGLFVALFAFRGENVGGDMIHYFDFYEGRIAYMYGSIEKPEIEIGYALFCKTLRFISGNGYFFIFVSSIVSLLPFLLLVNKYSNNRNLSLLWLLVVYGLTMTINIETNLRQNIATAFIMTGIYLVFNDGRVKYKQYLIILLLLTSCFIHTTSLILIPIMVCLYFIPLTKKSAMISVVGSVIITVLMHGLFQDILQYISAYLTILNKDSFEHIADYVSSDIYGFSGTYASLLSYIPMTTWCCYNIYSSNKDEISNYWMKNMVFSVCMYNLASDFGMAFRMFYLFQLVGFVYVPQKLKNDKNFTVMMLIMAYYVYRFIDSTTNPLNYNTTTHVLPYYFFFE